MALQEVQATKAINFGAFSIKPNEYLFLEEKNDSIVLKSNDISVSIPKENFKEPLTSLFVDKEDIEKALTYGSEVCLVTKDGLRTYSVENIDFRNMGTTYVSLDLKAID